MADLSYMALPPLVLLPVPPLSLPYMAVKARAFGTLQVAAHELHRSLLVMIPTMSQYIYLYYYRLPFWFNGIAAVEMHGAALY